jgi:hypothetical protein
MLRILDYYIRKPPFTGQLYHDEQVRRLEGEVKQAKAVLTAEVRRQIAAQYRELIGQSPSDIWFRLRFAEFASVFLRDEQTAIDQCRHVQELAPHSYKPHMVLALSLGGAETLRGGRRASAQGRTVKTDLRAGVSHAGTCPSDPGPSG